MKILATSLLLIVALGTAIGAQPQLQIRYPGPTREAALRCPGAGCLGSVTASPGEQVEIWIAGSNLAGVSGIQFKPSEGIEVSNLAATNETVHAVLKISKDAALGKRTFTVTSPAGSSNEGRGEFNISTFRISNLKIDNVANTGGTLSFRVTFNYTDPTGAVSSEGLDLYSSLNISGRVIGGIGSGFVFKPEGRTPGAKAGVMSFTRTYEKMQGTTGAVFTMSLGAKDGRESDKIQAVF